MHEFIEGEKKKKKKYDIIQNKRKQLARLYDLIDYRFVPTGLMRLVNQLSDDRTALRRSSMVFMAPDMTLFFPMRKRTAVATSRRLEAAAAP